ncbi:MAG: DUF362 domain-containing protein [Deltaproteobacteria bacterium]|nr:DUF362 domain-containing protein [Deltaproteobacteria bacterium]
MNRRKFMELLAAASAAGTLPFRKAYAGLNLPEPGPEAKVFLAGLEKGSADETLAKAVQAAAETATDFSWLSKGDAVLIKPALNSGNPYPATTNPAGIRTMVELLKNKGAGRVVVTDMSGFEHVKLSPDELKGSSRELMIKSGMAQAAESAGAELYFPEEDGWDAFFEERPASGSNWKAGIMMPKILKDMDHVILMPRCGRHILAGSTLGMKAAVGYWRPDSRLEYHRDASTFQEKTAESNTVPSLRERQRLVLTSATKILTTFGPDKGYVSEPEIGLIIASESIVAHDMVSLAWLLENRRLTPDFEKMGFKDPYRKQLVVSNTNRMVVRWLGGREQSRKAEKLIRNDLNTIWDDRVLNRAYQLWGGVPKVTLVNVNGRVSDDIMKKLTAMTTRPA